VCVTEILASILFLNRRAKMFANLFSPLVVLIFFIFLLCILSCIYIPHMDDDSEGYIIKLFETVALTKQLYMTAIMHFYSR
jgi:H+/Cl- antiporter ClcA